MTGPLASQFGHPLSGRTVPRPPVSAGRLTLAVYRTKGGLHHVGVLHIFRLYRRETDQPYWELETAPTSICGLVPAARTCALEDLPEGTPQHRCGYCHGTYKPGGRAKKVKQP